MKKTDVYLITHVESGKEYVGVSCDVVRRWDQHQQCATRGGNTRLYNALRKYGSEAFAVKVFESCESQAQAFEREIALIAERRPFYNMTKGGDGVVGAVRTEETLRKMRAAKLGIPLSEEHKAKIKASHQANDAHKRASAERNRQPEFRAKMSAARKGKKASAETRAKLSAAKKGKPRSQECRDAIGRAHLGMKHTEEAKAKMSAANTGRKQSEETKAKRSASMLGHEVSAETRAKIGEAHRGKKMSEESKAKIRAAKANVSEETRARMRAAHAAHYFSKQPKLRINLLRVA